MRMRTLALLPLLVALPAAGATPVFIGARSPADPGPADALPSAATGPSAGLVQQMFFPNTMRPDLERVRLIWKRGLPPVAPSRDWADAGASVTIEENNGSIQILLNEQPGQATALKVPEEHQSNAKLIAAAN
jgi:hypothetical protein